MATLKYECVFLYAFETGSEASTGIGSWIDYYNARRPHSAFDGRTPDEVYGTTKMTEQLAAYETNPIHLSQAGKRSQQAGPPLRDIQPGDIFGELAAIDGRERSASALPPYNRHSAAYIAVQHGHAAKPLRMILRNLL